ncbi:helix-turn-helix transcriptional regulator [Sphingomonas sp. GC_Shp_3]|uniref:helix-turn-helix domain-containing protein n=1 Tax=Sphingomonas sp. GC_Shp_3 TaxID=2937383 RepID=UPI0022698731|nr:helix-turn-helix transcriptional regulator [Sphingomonas sp. GC_Shp_3]
MIDHLAAIRQEEGISQRELARRIGKPPSFVNKIELRERRLDLFEFIVIAEALGRQPGELLRILRLELPEALPL